MYYVKIRQTFLFVFLRSSKHKKKEMILMRLFENGRKMGVDKNFLADFFDILLEKKDKYSERSK